MRVVLAKHKPGTPDNCVYLTDVTLVETADGAVVLDAKTALFVAEAFVFPTGNDAVFLSHQIMSKGFLPTALPEPVALEDVAGLPGGEVP